ncbi:MAG: hypothetical protein Q7T55_15920, partial [Solirubrobacteraceae bacterium]|nr:hypothetical protein [Solirubrobacteraceae bacterium]
MTTLVPTVAHRRIPPLPPTSSATLFADIESVLGFVPHGSLALRIRRRRRSFAVLRVDLPPAAELARPPVRERLAHTVAGLLSQVRGATAADVVVYHPPGPGLGPGPGDAPMPPSASRVEGEVTAHLVGTLAACLSAAGFAVQSAHRVRDGWWARVPCPPGSGDPSGTWLPHVPATGDPGDPAAGDPATGRPATGGRTISSPATGGRAAGSPATGGRAAGSPATGGRAAGRGGG